MRNREDWLVEQLDSSALSPTLRAKYEAELDTMAEKHSAAETRRLAAEADEALYAAEIRARILANDLDLIATVGQDEFGHDYELVQEGDIFVVYSKVARDDQTHRRVHETFKKAESDLRYLLWNRLYSKYVRTGELVHLKELA